jgi:hypothetical protein
MQSIISIILYACTTHMGNIAITAYSYDKDVAYQDSLYTCLRYNRSCSEPVCRAFERN